MGLIDNYIMARAAKIKAAQEAKEAKEYSISLERKKYEESVRLNVKKFFNQIIEEKRKEMADDAIHIAIGDRVILNKYDLVKASSNGWDGGANTLITHAGKLVAPITAEITSIYIDESYAWEMFDKYVDSVRTEVLALIRDEDHFRNIFTNFVNRKNNSIFNDHGLYWTAHFKPSTEFTPHWGLNINSFLKLDSAYGMKTHDLWSREINVKAQLQSLREVENELIAEIQKVEQQIRTIEKENKQI